jgi:hypothetical protein
MARCVINQSVASTQWVAEVDVKVQMLRVLIFAQIGQDSRAAVFSRDLRRDLFDNLEKLDQ